MTKVEELKEQFIETRCQDSSAVGDLEELLQAVREEEREKARQELKHLSEMIKELSLVDKLLHGDHPLVKITELCYDECAGYLERLANGDKSVIERLTQPTKEK